MKKAMLLCLVVVLFATSLMAANKVVVIPLNTSQSSTDKLWGKGRPGIKLKAHLGSTGYCTTPTGINFALSNTYVAWYSAADACPTGTWVCSVSNILSSGKCDIVPEDAYSRVYCDGSNSPYVVGLSKLKGWVADICTFGKGDRTGQTIDSDAFSPSVCSLVCGLQPVWCCWN